MYMNKSLHSTWKTKYTTIIIGKLPELRSWLCFFGLPCLRNVLPDLYLQHFACLSESIHSLLTKNVTEQDLIGADVLLQAFLSK
jgi:hypothetical protein